MMISSSQKCDGMNQSDVILELMRRSGISSKRELARATKIPHSTINKLIDGAQVNSRDDTLKPLADYFQVSLQQLRGYAPLDDRPGMPVLEAGEISYWLAGTLHRERMSEFVKSTQNLSAKAFAIRTPDDALEEYPEGTLLIVDPEAKGNGNDVCLIMSKGRAGFRLLKEDLGRYMFLATHAGYQSIGQDDCELVGYAVAKPEESFAPRFDGEDRVPRTTPAPNSEDIVDLTLQRECRKISERVGEEDGATEAEIRANAQELYNYCIMTGKTAEALRQEQIETALDLNNLTDV